MEKKGYIAIFLFDLHSNRRILSLSAEIKNNINKDIKIRNK